MKQTKVIGLVVMLLLLASMVSATHYEQPDEFREVTCGRGYWDGSVCAEWELQDEFNEVQRDIENNQDDIKDNAGNIEENQEDIEDLEDGLSRNFRRDRQQSRNINELESVVFENEDKWSSDRKGTSLGSVKKYLYADFFDYLKGIFATPQEVNVVSDEVYLLRAKIALLEDKYGEIASDEQVIATAAEIKRIEQGTDSAIVNNQSCREGVCISQ